MLATLDKCFDAKGFDFFFAVDSEFFADLHLDGETVRIPTGLAFAAVASHGSVAREQILDRARQAMARVGHAVGSWRSFEKDKGWGIFSELERLFVDPILFPEGEGFILELRKFDIRLNSLKHELKIGGE